MPRHLADLRGNPGNPRKLSEEQHKILQHNLEIYGDLSGFVFNTTTGNLVGGHQRQKSLPPDSEIEIITRYDLPTQTGTTAEGFIKAKTTGERFAYREVAWPPDREMAANIAANKAGGEWDFGKLAAWAGELIGNGWEPMDLGWSDSEMENILAPHRPTEGEDDVPEPPKEAKTKRGELWILGEHRLLIDDCTVKENVGRLMAGERADMVFTDPPYGVGYQMDMSPEEAEARNRRKDGKEVANDSITGEDLRAFLALALYGSTLKPGGVFYVCSPPGCTETDFRLSLGDEFPLRQALVWVKQQFVFGRQDYHWRHETILYGWREGGAHYFIDDRTQDTVWNFDRPFKSPEHPTMKPIELIEKAVINSSHAGQSIYDCFLGSGSTLIACEKTNRRCFGMEIEPLYGDVIIERWEKFSGKQAVREDGVTWGQLSTKS